MESTYTWKELSSNTGRDALSAITSTSPPVICDSTVWTSLTWWPSSSTTPGVIIHDEHAPHASTLFSAKAYWDCRRVIIVTIVRHKPSRSTGLSKSLPSWWA
jgi:hypothetical protein